MDRGAPDGRRDTTPYKTVRTRCVRLLAAHARRRRPGRRVSECVTLSVRAAMPRQRLLLAVRCGRPLPYLWDRYRHTTKAPRDITRLLRIESSICDCLTSLRAVTCSLLHFLLHLVSFDRASPPCTRFTALASSFMHSLPFRFYCRLLLSLSPVSYAFDHTRRTSSTSLPLAVMTLCDVSSISYTRLHNQSVRRLITHSIATFVHEV